MSNKLIEIYRNLGNQVRSKAIDLNKLTDDKSVIVKEVPVRDKLGEFENKHYKAFNVTIDDKTYYADFLVS